MQAQYVHDGKHIDFTPDIDVPVGSIVIQGDLVGITKRDLKADVLGSIAVEGIFDVSKDPAQAVALTAGQKVYVDAGGEPRTIATGNTYLGKAVAPAAADGNSVRVRLGS